PEIGRPASQAADLSRNPLQSWTARHTYVIAKVGPRVTILVHVVVNTTGRGRRCDMRIDPESAINLVGLVDVSDIAAVGIGDCHPATRTRQEIGSGYNSIGYIAPKKDTSRAGPAKQDLVVQERKVIETRRPTYDETEALRAEYLVELNVDCVVVLAINVEAVLRVDSEVVMDIDKLVANVSTPCDKRHLPAAVANLIPGDHVILHGSGPICH